MYENKQEILNNLAQALNLCRITGNDNIKLEYQEEREVVLIWSNRDDRMELLGKVNVACDSGVAMVRDVLCNDYFS